MKTQELFDKSSEVRAVVSAFAGYLKENYGEEIMVKSSLISQMFHSVEDFYWELAGAGDPGEGSQLILVGMMIDKAEVNIGNDEVSLVLYKHFDYA